MKARLFTVLLASLLATPALAQQPAPPGKPIVAPNRVAGEKLGSTGMLPAEMPKVDGQGGPDGTMIPAQGMPPSNGEATKPVIKCEPDPLDLGEMVVDTTKGGKVKLINISDKPVTVTKAITSCGCTTAGTPKEPIAPGGFAEVEISLKAGPKPGASLSKRVTFQVEGHAPTIMTVQGKVPAYVTLSPDIIEAPGEGQTSEGTLTLKSVDGTPFKITAVVPPIVSDAGSDAKTEHVVHIDWNQWRETGRTIKLSFNLDHPKAPSLSCLIRRPPGTPGSPTAPAGPTPAEKTASELVTAARSGDVEAVKKQLDAGAKIDAPASAGDATALHWAAKEGRDQVVALLIERGADLKATRRDGKNALCIAGESGRTEVAKQLLDAAKAKNIDIVNSVDRLGGTPLMWTAALGKPETVQLLLANGATVNVADKNGLTPLLWAAGIGDPKSVKLLIEAKADLKAADNLTGDTAIMRAARNGKVESMQELIAAGADLAATNRQGMTAWLIASANGKVEKLKVLQAAKADVSVKDARGWNAVDYAKNRSDGNRDEVLKYLQDELKLQPTAQQGSK